MKKIKFLLKIGTVVILLQGLMYCPIDWGQIDQDIQQETVDAYLESVLKATRNRDVFYNFTEIFKNNACRVFSKHFEKLFFLDFKLSTQAPLSIEILGKRLQRNGSGALALAHIATLAQDTPQCWNAQIRKIENIIKSTEKGKFLKFKEMFRKSKKQHVSELAAKNDLLKEAKFLYEIFLDSAARSYAFMEEIYLKNKKLEKWWHLRSKLTRTASDFYILAVLNSVRIFMPHDFKDIRDNFLKNFRSYLKKSKLNTTDTEINDIVAQIEKKSMPSNLRKYWKWWLAAGLITTVGITYWIYQNQDVLQKNLIDRFFGKPEKEPEVTPKKESPTPENPEPKPADKPKLEVQESAPQQPKGEGPKVEKTPEIANPPKTEPKLENAPQKTSDIENTQKEETKGDETKSPRDTQKHEVLPQQNKFDENKDIESDESDENNEPLSGENKSGENIKIDEQKEGELQPQKDTELKSDEKKPSKDQQKDGDLPKVEEQKNSELQQKGTSNENTDNELDQKLNEPDENKKQQEKIGEQSGDKNESLQQKPDLEKEKGSETKSEEQKNRSYAQ